LRRFFCFIGNVLPYETECSAGKKYPLTGPESAPLLLEKRKKENKIMKKKVLAVILGAAMTVSLAACGSSGADSSGSGSGETSYTIGISQFAEHGSLDNCREGFIQGLAEEGIVEGENLTIEEGNAASDAGTARQISDGFVSDSVDLVCAIATPSAEAAYVSAMNTDIPVVYTAVTDPLAAKLADEDGTPVGNVTGTSDELPIKEQLEMIRAILPDAEKIGIMYTTSEVNSVSALETYKELAGDYGFTIVESGVTQTADISLAADNLLSEVDCLTNLTDNTVVNSLATILDKANEQNIPVFGSEIEQVRKGCLAAEGLDYIELGKQTGRMAAKILKGEAEASEMNFETISEPGFYVNLAVAEQFGITIDEELLSTAVESFDSIGE
jgi:putative ABC transport system substrate-binding protein